MYYNVHSLPHTITYAYQKYSLSYRWAPPPPQSSLVGRWWGSKLDKKRSPRLHQMFSRQLSRHYTYLVYSDVSVAILQCANAANLYSDASESGWGERSAETNMLTGGGYGNRLVFVRQPNVEEEGEKWHCAYIPAKCQKNKNTTSEIIVSR